MKPFKKYLRAIKAGHMLSKYYSHINRTSLRQLDKLLTIIEMDYGHRESFLRKRPINKSGSSLPWLTYPAIEYLNQLDFKKKVIFEWGCGEGSLYWASRANSVISVEHDRKWYNLMRKRLGKKNKIFLFEDRKRYAKAIETVKQRFDVIVIDGEFRSSCADYATKYIKPTGIIILDNSDWFIKAAEVLREKGLLQVDFSGFGPINYYTWTTSIFFTDRAREKMMLDFKGPSPIGGRRIKVKDE